jgi:hypothetical protein
MGEDFYRVSGNGTASGPVVFAKDGWLVKSKGIDAYQGVDVKGKIVVLYSQRFSQQTMIGRPEGVTQDDLKGEVGVDWASPLAYAKAKGAAGLIVIAPPELQQRWGQLRGFLGRGRTYVDKLREGPADTGISPPAFIVSDKVGDALFAGESADKTSSAAFETKKTASMSSATKTERL